MKELSARLELYREKINVLRDTDVLLSSPKFYETASKGLISGYGVFHKTPRDVCDNLKRTGKKLLQSDFGVVTKTRMNIESKMKETDWIKDTDLKVELWSSSSRFELISNLKSDSGDFQKSTFCRMEARYGEGHIYKQNLKQASLVGGSFFLPAVGRFLGKVAVEGINAGRIIAPELIHLNRFVGWKVLGEVVKDENIMIAATAQRVGNILGIAAGFIPAVPAISDACKEKIKMAANKKTCEATSDEQYKKLFFLRQEANQCALIAGMGIVSAGIGVYATRGLLKEAVSPSLSADVESRLIQTQALNKESLISSPNKSVKSASVPAQTVNKEEQLGQTLKEPIDPSKKMPSSQSEVASKIQKAESSRLEGLIENQHRHIGISPKLDPSRRLNGTQFYTLSGNVKADLTLFDGKFPGERLERVVLSVPSQTKKFGSDIVMAQVTPFQKKMGFYALEDGKTVVRPANGQAYNRFIDKYNKSVPKEEKIPLKVEDDFSYGGKTSQEVVDDWSERKVFLNQVNIEMHGHDNFTHTENFLRMTETVMDRSSHNMGLVSDLMKAPLFRENIRMQVDVYEDLAGIVDRATLIKTSDVKMAKEFYNSMILDPQKLKEQLIKLGASTNEQMKAIDEMIARFKPQLTPEEAQRQIDIVQRRLK